jgi:diaminohydroxyphosphoribosylaminopyrimidine deaminase/5-amino-6-(5-phosphoribosylamino)uracil reductase
LGHAGLTSVLVEGGSQIAGAIVGAGLVDRVVAFVAPMIVGGDGLAAVAGFGRGNLADVPRLRDLDVARVGADLVVTGTLRTSDRALPFASAWPPR